MRPHIAIGIDVGFSATAPSTGVVIIDRATKLPPVGTELAVLTMGKAMEFVRAELERLRPASQTACVDGPFAAPAGGGKARGIERFFASGPFSSAPPGGGPRLRVSAAPTKAGGKFLLSTLGVLDDLSSMGIRPMNPLASRGSGTAVEIFPTLFMAALMPPETYSGKRNHHSDDLWRRLMAATKRAKLSPLAPYVKLMDAVEKAPRSERHDLRAAAICAIGADTLGPDGSLGQATFLGSADEGGFLLPPAGWWNGGFRAIFDGHLVDRQCDLDLKFAGRVS